MRIILLLCAAFALDAAAAGPVEKMTDVQQNVQPALVEKQEIVPVVEEDGGMERWVTCPIGWEEVDSRCFKFFNRKLSWIDAERYCLRYQANLASIHSSDEHVYIQTLVKDGADSYVTSWVGGTDAVKNRQWFWSDGSVFTKTFWALDEPNNLQGREHCIAINDPDEFRWKDLPCDLKFPFVCGTRPLQSF